MASVDKALFVSAGDWWKGAGGFSSQHACSRTVSYLVVFRGERGALAFGPADWSSFCCWHGVY